MTEEHINVRRREAEDVESTGRVKSEKRTLGAARRARGDWSRDRFVTLVVRPPTARHKSLISKGENAFKGKTHRIPKPEGPYSPGKGITALLRH